MFFLPFDLMKNRILHLKIVKRAILKPITRWVGTGWDFYFELKISWDLTFKDGGRAYWPTANLALVRYDVVTSNQAVNLNFHYL